MTCRLLLASHLLLLGFHAQAALDHAQAAQQHEAGPTCTPGTLTAPDAVDAAKPEAVAPAIPSSPAAPRPALQRPGLRWHSFLPGMMK